MTASDVANYGASDNANVTSITVEVNTLGPATAGNRLLAAFNYRVGGTATLSTVTGWDTVGDYVDGDNRVVLYERIATGTSGDNITCGGDLSRYMALHVVEIAGLKTTGSYDQKNTDPGGTNGWTGTAVTDCDTGGITPTAAPGIAIAIIAVKDRQNWYSGGDDSTASSSINGGFTGYIAEHESSANCPSVGFAFLNYSDTSAIPSATWTSIDTGSTVFGGIVCYEEQTTATQPTVDAGGDYEGEVSTAISLDATVTPGTDASPTYQWSIVSRGTGTFSGSPEGSIVDPTFTPDSIGTYILRLTVSTSDTDDVIDTCTLYSTDTGGAWTVTNGTAVLNATGLSGVANTGTTLTATSANCTAIASAVTMESGTHTARFFLRRKAGTGDVDITMDGGSTWETVTLTDTFTEFVKEQTLANPSIGIRLVTSGDAIAVGNTELYLNTTEEEVTGIAFIWTYEAPVTGYRDSPSEMAGTWTSSTEWAEMPGNSRHYPMTEGSGDILDDLLDDPNG